MQLHKNCHDVFFHHLPTLMEKRHNETIWPQHLVTIQIPHHLPNFLLLKISFQPITFIRINGKERKTIHLWSPSKLLRIQLIVELHYMLLYLSRIRRHGKFRGQLVNHNALNLWRLASLCLMWCLWRERNERIFEDREN